MSQRMFRQCVFVSSSISFVFCNDRFVSSDVSSSRGEFGCVDVGLEFRSTRRCAACDRIVAADSSVPKFEPIIGGIG